MDITKFIDHTLLKPTATLEEIKQLCKEAKSHGFFAVCVNGCHVPLAKSELEGSGIRIASVVGFPLGAMSTKAKIGEAYDTVAQGSDEIDMVMNIGWLKSNKDAWVLKEIQSLKNNIGDKVLKVILENCFLTQEEKIRACKIALQAGADYIKTSTGFGPGGATLDDVSLMKNTVGNNIKIKASGGIKDHETAMKFIELGVSRIGTSSGPSLLKTS